MAITTTGPVYILLVDETNGIYIPQQFVLRFKENIVGLGDMTDPKIIELQANLSIVSKGPAQEEYWEAWEEVVRDVTLLFTNDSTEYTIEENGDLWAVPVNE